MSKRVEIIVDTKGNSKVETKGFAGRECVEASKFIEQALGMETASRTTAEFYQSTMKNNQIQTQGTREA